MIGPHTRCSTPVGCSNPLPQELVSKLLTDLASMRDESLESAAIESQQAAAANMDLRQYLDALNSLRCGLDEFGHLSMDESPPLQQPNASTSDGTA